MGKRKATDTPGRPLPIRRCDTLPRVSLTLKRTCSPQLLARAPGHPLTHTLTRPRQSSPGFSVAAMQPRHHLGQVIHPLRDLRVVVRGEEEARTASGALGRLGMPRARVELELEGFEVAPRHFADLRTGRERASLGTTTAAAGAFGCAGALSSRPSLAPLSRWPSVGFSISLGLTSARRSRLIFGGLV